MQKEKQKPKGKTKECENEEKSLDEDIKKP